jgi:hypothetical protein
MIELTLLLSIVCVALNFKLDSFNVRSDSPGRKTIVTG